MEKKKGTSSPKYKATPRMKKIQEEQKLLSKDLAKMAGVTEPTISRFDTQKRYDIDVLASVSRALGVTIEDLFEIEKVEEGAE
jgi:transcriptional regulator with XRE-family HTH domain